VPMPEWQQRAARHAALAPGFVSAALVLLGAGLALVGLVWMQAPRRAAAPPAASSTTAPPDDLPLLLASTLRSPGAQPRMLHVLAALLDLARRGFVEIAETPRSSRLSGREFTIRRTDTARPTHEHERRLLDIVLPEHGLDAGPVKYTEARKRLQKRWAEIKALVRQELVAARFVNEERERARHHLRTLSWVVFGAGVAGIAAGIAFVHTHGPAAMLPGAGLALAGLAGLIVVESMSVLSEHGERELARWKGFAEGVHDGARGRAAVGDPDPLARLLPWAVAFGLGPALFKQLRRQQAPLPAWFHPALAAHDDGSAAFVAFLSVHGSTSGAAGGASGTGGAGGGGASGAR
jgi:hypothetical protein